jgi:hypothetical protein
VDLTREVVELKSIASAYRKRSRLRLAADVLRTAWSIQRNLYGPDDPEIALTIYQIGEIHSDLEEYDLARQFYKQAVDMWMRVRPNSTENALYFNEAMMQLQLQSDRDEQARESKATHLWQDHSNERHAA